LNERGLFHFESSINSSAPVFVAGACGRRGYQSSLQGLQKAVWIFANSLPTSSGMMDEFAGRRKRSISSDWTHPATTQLQHRA
jgi:hypothetical protein